MLQLQEHIIWALKEVVYHLFLNHHLPHLGKLLTLSKVEEIIKAFHIDPLQRIKVDGFDAIKQANLLSPNVAIRSLIIKGDAAYALEIEGRGNSKDTLLNQILSTFKFIN